MGRRQKIAHTRRRTFVLSFIVAALAFVGLGIGIYQWTLRNVDDLSFDVGADNISETYKEVASTFTEVSTSRWNYLDSLGHMLDLTINGAGDISVVREHLATRDFGETNFFMLNEDGGYMTLDGASGYIDLGDSLYKLVDEGEDIIIDGSLPGRDNMVFYISPVQRNTYNDFSYVAVGFSYDKQAIGESLQINSYGGTSKAYMVYPNGRVAFALGEDALGVKNLFSYLTSTGVASDKSARVTEAFSNEGEGTILVTVEGTDYYLNYQPAGTQGLMLVSFTPASYVNRSISNIAGFAMNVVFVAAIALIAACVGVLGYALWRTMAKRDAALQEKDLVYELISSDLDSVYILYRGKEHEVIYVSPNVERILGVNVDDVYDNPFALHACRLSDRNYASRIDDMDKLLPGGKITEECELKNVQTGLPDLFLYELYRPKGENSNIVMGIISNRAEEEERRQEIRDALEVAREASESKSVFLSNMSHDIRTPMNAIVGFVELAEHNISDKTKVQEYLDKVKASAQHLLSLINDVLDMSKIEAGKAQLNLEELDMADIVNDVADMMRGQAADKEITLETHFNLEPQVEVGVDRLRLSQILINVLSNAVKYTPEGGHVWFKVDRIDADDESVARYRYVVQDNGIGMSEDFVKEIFTSFSREERSTTNKIQGTGLGMAITKNLIDLMNGTITVESKQDVGSVFTIVLEFGIAVAAKKTIRREKRVAGTSSIAGLNILAAEDNAINAELLTDLMDLEHANCEIVENGKLLVERFNSSGEDEFDIILTDIQMPVMDGYEATKEIRAGGHARAKTIPIVAMSAAVFSDDVARSYAAGMNAHVAKPIDMDNLKSTVCELLENPTTFEGGGILNDTR